MAARGFIGAGNVYINRTVAGVPQGRMGPYYASKFEIKPNVQKKDLISKGRDDYGQVLETVSVQQPADFTLELNEVNKDSMVLALLGTEANLTQAAGTWTAQALALGALGVWSDLGKKNVTGALTVTDSAAATTYVEGTDYLVNRQLGWIQPIAGGAMTASENVKLTGAYGAVAGSVIRGATNTDIRAELIFDGVNQADGLPCIVTVREAVIAADAAFDFLADDFNKVSLPGTMKTPTGATEPFTVELRTAS